MLEILYIFNFGLLYIMHLEENASWMTGSGWILRNMALQATTTKGMRNSTHCSASVVVVTSHRGSDGEVAATVVWWWL